MTQYRSYELSGWTDVPTLPSPRTRRRVRLPSTAGGPLIICLDTSWSMSGIRESLAKAVVLACVTAAHAQGRECRVVSFSSANNAVESGTIACDADGVRRLLDFLSYSFGGGTDVTGALKFAVSVDLCKTVPFELTCVSLKFFCTLFTIAALSPFDNFKDGFAGK